MRTRRGWGRTNGCITLILLAMVFLGDAMPVAAENWFEQGLIELKNGRYQNAVDAFTIAIESVPHDFEAFNNRGFARIYTGDYDGAIADCSQAIRYSPGSAKAYNNRGFAHIFKGSYEVALTDFDSAIAINPRYVDAYSNRCLAWIRQERYTRAVTDCSQALAINPRSAKALYNRGFARDRQGDHAGALGDYIQALTVNPDYIEVFNNIAWILATSQDPRLRDGQRAVVLAEKAAAHSTDVNFMDTLAAAYAEAGRYDEAVAMENRVVSILAERGTTGNLGPHVERLSLYEEGRPYRDPVKVRSVSAVTDLSHKFETLDRLMQPGGIQTADYRPVEPDQAPGEAEATVPAVQMAQATPAAAANEIQVLDQTVFTTAGEPVEITLGADSSDQLPITFDIVSVPFQGALHGTLPHLIYTPRTGFTGTDRFNYRAGNAAVQSRLATVVINVGQKPDKTAMDSDTPVSPAADDAPQPSMASSAQSEAEEDQMPTPAVSLPTEPMPGTAAMKPAEGVRPAAAERPAGSSAPATQPSPPGGAPVRGLPEGLSADSLYSIQVRSIKASDIAAQEIAELRREGFVAFSHVVEIPGKGIWHRIFINGYPTMAAARRGLADLDAARFKDAYVRRLPDTLHRPATPPPAAATVTVPTPEPPAVEEEPPITYPYSFQIKSYRDKNDAFQLGVELTSLGRKAIVGVSRLGTTGDWHRVYVGCFRSPEEGEKMRDDLAAEGFEDAFLTVTPYTIAIRPPDHDPRGEALENQLLSKGYLPYRLPERDNGGQHHVLIGGFQSPQEARSTLEALQDIGYDAQVVPR